MLEKLRVPVARRLWQPGPAAVLNHAKTRAATAKKAGNSAYAQVRIKGANHFTPTNTTICAPTWTRGWRNSGKITYLLPCPLCVPRTSRYAGVPRPPGASMPFAIALRPSSRPSSGLAACSSPMALRPVASEPARTAAAPAAVIQTFARFFPWVWAAAGGAAADGLLDDSGPVRGLRQRRRTHPS